MYLRDLRVKNLSAHRMAHTVPKPHGRGMTENIEQDPLHPPRHGGGGQVYSRSLNSLAYTQPLRFARPSPLVIWGSPRSAK